jgi:deoxyribodipyrimidine photo-lyase
MRTALWWIRRDLRLEDNQALAQALKEAERVIPVFILDPSLLSSSNASPQRIQFLFEGLFRLDESLRERKNQLVIREGKPSEVLARLVQESSAEAIFAEEDYSPYARQRDNDVKRNLPLLLTGSPVVRSPWGVLKPDATPYTVFTPYSRAWKAFGSPGWLPAPGHIPGIAHLKSLPIPTDQTNFPGSMFFPAGEKEAQSRLAKFLGGEEAPIYDYDEKRNLLAEAGTSGLSPYFRFGMLSARRAATAVYRRMQETSDPAKRKSAETWLNELIWREFYVQILYHFPHAHQESFREPFRNIPWQNDPADFEAWCMGHTGVPVVDAAMRQLLQMGWMHNRARMIAASYLTKDLLIDWRWGERWFMQHLVDGDPAANNGGWQWTAGTGTDAAPYFRIFNPVTQGLKFDPQARYVHQWLPELRGVPPEYAHQPWKMPTDVQRKVGVILGKTYPFPRIDHALARERALQAYASVKDAR